jgi:hypothetical protein
MPTGLAVARERFDAKLLDLIERSEGREPDPATLAHAQLVACLLWTDPEEAVRWLKHAAAEAMARAATVQTTKRW